VGFGGVNFIFPLDRVRRKMMMQPMLKSGTKFLVVACLAVAMAALIFGGWGRLSRKPALRNAENLMQTERLDAAAALVDQFLREHPDDSDALRVRFYLLLKTEHFADALTTYRRLLAGDAVLTAALTHRDTMVRAGAARLICEQSLPVESAKLINSLGDSDPTVRRYCADSLGHRREATALKPLFQLLGDDNWYVRAKAAESLGELGDPRAAGWLLQLLNENDGLVRWNATVALRQVAAESNRETLRGAFANAKSAKQLAIAIALAKLRDPLAYAPLTNAVNAVDATTRRYVAEALGDFPAAWTTNQLLKLAADANDGVREEARRSLQKVESGGRRL